MQSSGLEQPCPNCGGSGTVANGTLICPKCDGSGEDPGIERWFVYIYQITLTANQLLSNLRIVTNGDAPFRIKMLCRTKTGAFRIRLFDSVNHYFSSGGEGSTNDRVRDDCIFGDGQLPYIVVPHVVIPSGGYIGFDLEDVSNASNTIHLAFEGAKIYPSTR